jgi:TRAP-type mannitol/chloroaromatic compound transport system permease large subunit
MLAGLYIGYIIVYSMINPEVAPPLSEEERYVPLPPFAEEIVKSGSNNALTGLIGAIAGKRGAGIPMKTLVNHLFIVSLPLLVSVLIMGSIYLVITKPEVVDTSGLQEMGSVATTDVAEPDAGGLAEPEDAGGLQEPPAESGLEEPAAVEAAAEEVQPPPAVATAPPVTEEPAPVTEAAADTAPGGRLPAPTGFWITLGICIVSLVVIYSILTFVRLEIFKMLLKSFFPLSILITGVLGSIIAGLATPTEAAAMGSFGALIMAIAYGRFNMTVLKESVFLTAKTSAMVCWLFVGSGIFAGAFALLGGQEIINTWVQSLDMSPVQFMLLAQVIIFLLGWPLEWTEIIVIFLPIFLPLLTHFHVDPLFFGLLVALNLQTAFLSPPVAMAAFYLKGVSPPHVTLNQIFLGMLPFMAIQIFAIILLYMFPAIALWLPSILYGH